MKIIKTLILIFLISCINGCVCQGNPNPILRKANSTILPGTSLQVQGASVPVVNFYRRLPGCYIACYDKNNKTQMKGLVRVNGLYLDKNCQPQGYFFKDLSAIPYFKNVCNKNLANCQGNCWADGDTGRFLGITQ